MSIQLRDVHKSFGPIEVLRGFTLEVKDGETVAVIGASGSGKSVMLKHVVALLDPDRGEVRVDGQTVHELKQDDLYELRKKVGYVFQFAALFDSMTVAENVSMGLRRMTDLSKPEIDDRVAECLRVVELEGFEEKYPAELSGGQKKRAGLARAIATRPKYLLYDEPTTGLDPVTATIIDRLIVRTRDELGATGVVVTHDIDSACDIADRVGMLYEGRVRFVGTPDELRTTEDPVVKGFVEGRPELLEDAW